MCPQPEKAIHARFEERSFILLCSHRIEVLHSVGCKSSSYLFSGCHACQGVPIAHWFAHCHYVGTETLPLLLESPEVTPQSSKARLHLVCHKHSTSWTHVPLESVREIKLFTTIIHVAEKNKKQPVKWVTTHSATLVEYPWGKMICPPTLGNDSAKKAEIYCGDGGKFVTCYALIIFATALSCVSVHATVVKSTLRPFLCTSSIRSFTVSAYAWPGLGWSSLYMPL